jgi:hypothetical protein
MELSPIRHDLKEVGMFLNECTACGREQLIFLSQVSAYVRTSRGVEAHFTCWCGAEQTWLAAPAAQAQPVAA